MSLLSQQSPKTHFRRKRKVLLALSQIGIHGIGYKNKQYQKEVETNLKKVHEELIIKNTNEIDKDGNLTLDMSTCNEEAYDMAIIHLRSPLPHSLKNG
jgi:hypothetical protein